MGVFTAEEFSQFISPNAPCVICKLSICGRYFLRHSFRDSALENCRRDSGTAPLRYLPQVNRPRRHSTRVSSPMPPLDSNVALDTLSEHFKTLARMLKQATLIGHRAPQVARANHLQNKHGKSEVRHIAKANKLGVCRTLARSNMENLLPLPNKHKAESSISAGRRL